jgi:hypothetical protein
MLDHVFFSSIQVLLISLLFFTFLYLFFTIRLYVLIHVLYLFFTFRAYVLLFL